MRFPLLCGAIGIQIFSSSYAKPIATKEAVQLPFPVSPGEDPQPVSDIIPVTQYINTTALLESNGQLEPPADVLAVASAPLVKRVTGLYQYSNSQDWPYKCVGRVLGPSFVCTGVLVSRRLVLTARHCAAADGSYSFSPAYDNGNTPLGTANVVYKALPQQSSSCQTVPQDFAYFALDQDFGPDFLNVVVPNPDYFNKGIFTQMGYPGGDRSYRQDGLSISQQSNQCSSVNGNEEAQLTANAVSNPGSSGSPLWTYPGVIYGVVSSAIITDYGGYPTLYASGAEMKVTLDNLKAYFG